MHKAKLPQIIQAVIWFTSDSETMLRTLVLITVRSHSSSPRFRSISLPSKHISISPPFILSSLLSSHSFSIPHLPLTHPYSYQRIYPSLPTPTSLFILPLSSESLLSSRKHTNPLRSVGNPHTRYLHSPTHTPPTPQIPKPANRTSQAPHVRQPPPTNYWSPLESQFEPHLIHRLWYTDEHAPRRTPHTHTQRPHLQTHTLFLWATTTWIHVRPRSQLTCLPSSTSAMLGFLTLYQGPPLKPASRLALTIHSRTPVVGLPSPRRGLFLANVRMHNAENDALCVFAP
ncbi:hypothetical protein Hypma_008375 [Hypsizygus marmoreus]|uniref:Uncharacterized protein n=1 Tax=Hypsizygus marmoreus TaxID=39966 RepID=A0A369JQ64_HYPMA|nr:hypothetical protein Hypma_008375 [Hypsizygus marmoreus]